MKQGLDFIVIGAQKAGTTSLFEYLRHHPALCLPAAKEVPYFSHDANYSRDWFEYLRKAFPFADPFARWGTVTPQYMVGGVYDPASDRTGAIAESDEHTVPTRIHQRLPDARLIAILRDPVERARSHHAMGVLNGWEARPFSQAVDELLTSTALAGARRLPRETTGYVVWGEYGRILHGYLDVFPREQLLVLFSAELADEPQAVVRRVLEFLDVDADFVPANLGTSYRQGGSSRRLQWLDLNLLQSAVASDRRARKLWHAIPEPARRRVDQQFDRLNYGLELRNRRPGTTGGASHEDTVGALRAHYAPDARRLARLIGVAAPWTSAVGTVDEPP